MQCDAKIVKSFGRNFIVETSKNQCFNAYTRSKSTDFVCGDNVLITIINASQAVIEKYYPRESIIYRQYKQKNKLLASNITQIIFIIAPIPTPNFNLLQRIIIVAESQNIKILIVANKSDLKENNLLIKQLDFYTSIGYSHINFSIFGDKELLLSKLKNNYNILIGQSGVGKSSILNFLLDSDIARISDNLTLKKNKGKHTTTFTSLYKLDENTSIIDSPGIQMFGLNYIPLNNLINYFPDMKDFVLNCKFHNCTHINEFGCDLIKKAKENIIDPDRLIFYQKLYKELENHPKYNNK